MGEIFLMSSIKARSLSKIRPRAHAHSARPCQVEGCGPPRRRVAASVGVVLARSERCSGREARVRLTCLVLRLLIGAEDGSRGGIQVDGARMRPAAFVDPTRFETGHGVEGGRRGGA